MQYIVVIFLKLIFKQTYNTLYTIYLIVKENFIIFARGRKNLPNLCSLKEIVKVK